MTGTELKTFTESILDGDTLESTFFFQLLNLAKDRIEGSRPWMYLRKLDTSHTAPVGNNSQNPIACPTDWNRTWKVYVGADTLFTPVPYDQAHAYANSSNKYYVDVANENLYLLGNIGRADTVYHYYLRTTDDIITTTSPVFPARFHAILGFEVAGYIQMGVDADDLFARMSPENKMQAKLTLDAMERWDTTLQFAEQNNQLLVSETETGTPLSMM